MIGLLLVGVFLAIVFSYVATEYQLDRFNVWARVATGRGFPLLALLGVNVISFAVMWTSAAVLVFASGGHGYLQATAVCAFAQALWLGQHLWSYHRNRLRFEN